MERINLVRTIAGNTEYTDCDPKHVKEFLKHGWAVFEGELPTVEPVAETVNKADISSATREQLIGMAVANGMPKGKASQSKKEDLLTFLNS